jgi:uncharacterized linocin/CFP29 family protein
MSSDVQVDFVMNNQGNSDAAIQWLNAKGDVNALRPFVGNDNRSYVNQVVGQNEDGTPKVQAVVTNSGATLRKNEWQFLDSIVSEVARKRLTLINNMRSAGMAVSFPGAYNHSVYQYQRMTDLSPATMNMNPRSRAENDRPTFDLVSVPLPIIHKEIEMDAREIAIRRNGGVPLETTALMQAAKRVAEYAEQLVLGSLATFTYGGASLYGLLNFPQRLTGTFLNPTVSGWNPEMMFNSVISMIKASVDNFHYGPWDLYYSTGLMSHMLKPFSAQYDGGSLVNRINDLPGINSVTMLDYLSGNQLLLVQRDPETSQILVGMDVTTVQWTENGGASQKLRVMAMMVPLMKTDANSTTGIVHFTGNATTV